MIYINGFYKGHYDMLWVRFSENGRYKLSNGFVIRDETASLLKSLTRVKAFSINGLMNRLQEFYPDHALLSALRRTKLT